MGIVSEAYQSDKLKNLKDKGSPMKIATRLIRSNTTRMAMPESLSGVPLRFNGLVT
jgi:hypothetical protein